MTHLLFGATGLIGSHLAKLIPENDLLITITRKPFSLNRTAHLNIVSGLSENELNTLVFQEKIDVVYCCLGTTIKVAGSREKFYQVDHELVVNIARLANRVKAKKMMVISALGANEKSSVFYNRTKGEMERDTQLLTPDVPQLIFLRPSLLLGDRSSLNQPVRSAEKAAIRLSPILDLLCRGPLKKYRPIHAATVAKKMLELSIDSHRQKQLLILENESLF